MNIPPATHTDPYFTQFEPHHFRFDREAMRLNLHADSDGRYMGVYVEVSYPNGPAPDAPHRIAGCHRLLLWLWWEEEGDKPF